MNITNVNNLPETLVKACSLEKHNKEGCISATTLKKGVREIILEDRHWDGITKDVSEMIWALFGTAVHALLEIETPDTFAEEKFEVQVSNHTVTGRLDNYDMKNGIIHDYKTASVWKVIYNNFEDWHTQGMIYAWLLRKSGLEANECRFTAMLKDFSKREAKLKPDYPKSEVYVYSFKVTDEELDKIEKFIYAKIEELEKFENAADEELPMCTEEERWADPTKYAVMKEGRKTAVKLFLNEEEANEYAEKLGKGHSVEVRPSVDKKCLDYCACCEFCPYWKEHYGDKSN